MATRSSEPKTRVRTGCLTCRKKKIKCDERRPTCANCDKPGRVCNYDLVTRNHHNPTLNGNLTNLSKFFQDRPDYSTEQLTSFMPVPAPIQWTAPRTLKNFEVELLNDPESHYPTSNPHLVRAQQTATHGLEALSAAAADYTSHAPPAYPDSYGRSLGAGTLNAIDPNLDTRRGSSDATEGDVRRENRSLHDDTADEQLAHALRIHAQQIEGVEVEQRVEDA